MKYLGFQNILFKSRWLEILSYKLRSHLAIGDVLCPRLPRVTTNVANEVRQTHVPCWPHPEPLPLFCTLATLTHARQNEKLNADLPSVAASEAWPPTAMASKSLRAKIATAEASTSRSLRSRPSSGSFPQPSSSSLRC